MKESQTALLNMEIRMWILDFISKTMNTPKDNNPGDGAPGFALCQDYSSYNDLCCCYFFFFEFTCLPHPNSKKNTMIYETVPHRKTLLIITS